MKPAKFDYEKPADVAAAIALLQESGGEGKLLAGGQSLVPMMNLRLAQPDILIDIRRLDELKRIEDGKDLIFVGAGVTHATIEDGGVPDASAGMMRAVARQIAYRAVRNRGTMGGSVAHADPSGDWPTALSALGAQAHVAGPGGRREVALADLFLGPFTTALEPEELIEGFSIPRSSGAARWGYYKVCRKPGEFADSIGAVCVDTERNLHSVYLGATGGAPLAIPEIAARLSDGAQEVSTADARDIVTRLEMGFDEFETQIHAVALSRAIARAFQS